jgi:hypothetical protein
VATLQYQTYCIQRASIRLLAKTIKGNSTAAVLKNLHSRRCVLQARINAYSERLKEVGLQYLVVLSESARSLHKVAMDAEVQDLYEEAENNPLPLDFNPVSLYPEEDEDEINTAAADLMAQRDEVGEPEHVVIWLPSRDESSTIEAQTCEMEVQHALAAKQITIIRACIGEKSILIQIKVRRGKHLGQAHKGRTWHEVNRAHATMVAAVATYKRCRAALDQLSPDIDGIHEARKTLLPIDKEDLKELKDVTFAKRVGQRRDKRAWFWGMIAEHESEEKYLEEGESTQVLQVSLTDTVLVNRVNWLRAKARWTRCIEQQTLLAMEMIWTFVGLYRRSIRWSSEREKGSLGMQSYASKQAAVWLGLARRAEAEFRLDKSLVKDLMDYAEAEEKKSVYCD